MKFFIALIFALAACSFVSAQDEGWVSTPYNPQNSTLSYIFNFGYDMSLVQVMEAGVDPSGEWVFLQVNSLEVNLASDGWYYRFNVEIYQGPQSNGSLTFEVNDSPPHLVNCQYN